MSREIITGVDAGTSAIKTVILEKNKNEVLPRVIGTGLSASRGLRKGYIINPSEAASSIKESLKQAENAAGFSVKNAFVSLGGISLHGIRSKGSILVSRTDHQITDGDLKRSISQSEIQLTRNSSSYLLNRGILMNSSVSYKIDGEPALGDPVGMKAEKLEAETLFITCLNQHLENLIKSAEIAGIDIEDVIAMPWATAQAVLNHQEKEVGSLVINIGGDTSSIIVFEEGNPISLEVLPIGSNHITYDIARGFQVSLNEAEELKLSYNPESSVRKKLGNIIEPRLNDIFELVQTHLSKINRAKLLPAGTVLTGGGANLAGIVETAKNCLSLPAQISQPRFLASSKHSVANPIWTTAVGICLANLTAKNNSGFISSRGILSRSQKNIFGWFKNLLP